MRRRAATPRARPAPTSACGRSRPSSRPRSAPPLSLPVVALLGFNPARGHYGTTALIIVYIVLPVLIKIVAALLIWYIRIEAERGSVRDEMRGRGAL